MINRGLRFPFILLVWIMLLARACPGQVLSITTPSIVRSTVGSGVNISLTASGGLVPYSWRISGTLPRGLQLNGSLLSGTPSEAGSAILTLQVSDSSGALAATEFYILVNPAIGVRDDPAPVGTVGAPYWTMFVVAGGTSPYKWSIITGSLPSGLVLDASDGIVSGKPLAAGNFQISVGVADANSATSSPKVFTISIRQTGSTLLGATNSPALPAGVVSKPYAVP